MYRILLLTMFFLAGAIVLLFMSERDAAGCASVRRLDDPSIHIAQESAIIVWDPVKKVQHFIRRAAFDTKAPDFGFLVPTPTMPKLPLETVEDGIFSAMDKWMLPKTVEQTRWSFAPMLCMFGGAAKSPMEGRMKSKDDVRVLHEQKVGGYEVNVLEADNAEELSQWIKKHGYSADPELYEWLTPYIANKWKITAFKISQDPTTGQLATTKAVRMSFHTDRPFFPYREPKGKKDPAPGGPYAYRFLRVNFVSHTRAEGKLGAAAWHADVSWSNELTDEQRQQLVKETGVPADEIPAKAWLTAFDDRASSRPGKDEVYFDPAKDQTPIVPPPFIKYSEVWTPLDVVVAGIAFLFLIGMTIKRVGWKGIRPTGPAPRPEPPKGSLPPPWSAS